MTGAIDVPLRNTRQFLAASTDLLQDGRAIRFRAEGWSMYPIIRDGDIVEVVSVHASHLCIGDILLCRLGDSLVAHRLVRIRKEERVVEVELRGDAAFANDVPVSFTQVMGRVRNVNREGIERRLDTTRARLVDRIVARLWRAKRWSGL